jgi:rod shape-determining protein MreC
MFFNRQQYIPLGLVLLLTLALFKLPGRSAAQLKLAIGGLFLPLFGLAAASGDLANRSQLALTPKPDLAAQIDSLSRENAKLRVQLAQTAGLHAENTRLRHILGITNRPNLNLKLAQVVGRDPANWWRAIRINLGLRDGITTNAPVLTPDGLVGRVAEPGFAHSLVLLIGDPDCRVAALIEDSRDHGVISPDSANPLDNVIVDMNYLSHTSRLKAGQRVVTSGLGGVFPKDILIGHVVDFRSVDFGLYTGARVRLAARLNALEEVWILLP